MIVGIVLSAGESKRMGTPKQLLPWGKSVILQQVIDQASASKLDKILVVLGSHADEIKGKIKLSSKALIVFNRDFQEGMSSSVRCGVKNAPGETDAYMLLLGDQPFINTGIIDKLIDGYRTNKNGIAIPIYGGKRGHPVIFGVKYKQELLAIGDGGAKVVVDHHTRDILEVPLDSPEILTDIDTPQDYRKANKQAQN